MFVAAIWQLWGRDETWGVPPARDGVRVNDLRGFIAVQDGGSPLPLVVPLIDWLVPNEKMKQFPFSFWFLVFKPSPHSTRTGQSACVQLRRGLSRFWENQDNVQNKIVCSIPTEQRLCSKTNCLFGTCIQICNVGQVVYEVVGTISLMVCMDPLPRLHSLHVADSWDVSGIPSGTPRLWLVTRP